jgi:DNA-binding beta-propeller fold protein YncE
LTDPALLDGPWDLALNDQGTTAQVFVANVISGTVTRLDLSIPAGSTPVVAGETQIASGYAWRPDPDALVVGPTGLAYDPSSGTLYVASTEDNAIFAIANAGTATSDQGMGQVVVQDNTHLHGPLGLLLAPNGNLIVSNGDAINADTNQPNEVDEFTTTGQFVGQFQVDNGNSGGAFGIALSTDNGEVRFAAVDDDTNSLDLWTFQQQQGPLAPRSSNQESGNQSPALALSFAALQQHKIDLVFSNPDPKLLGEAGPVG